MRQRSPLGGSSKRLRVAFRRRLSVIVAAVVIAVGLGAVAPTPAMAANFLMSGNVGVGGARVLAQSADGVSASGLADAAGNWVLSVPSNGYTVTPFAAGCTFSPPTLWVAVRLSDVSGINFTAACPRISGNTGATGVTVTTNSGNETLGLSDANGNYSLGVPQGTWTVTPAKFGCSFLPPSRLITVAGNVSGVNFTAGCAHISGNAGVGGARLLATNTANGASVAVSADGSGNYFLPAAGGLFPGTYTVTPFAAGCTFSPSSKSITVGTSNVSGVNFAYICPRVSGNAGAPGVTVTTNSGNGGLGVSDANGNYSLGVPQGTWTVTPAKSGCSFLPPSRPITVAGNVSGVNFTAGCADIHGLLDDGSAMGLAGATVVLQPWGRTATTDAQGWFVFWDVPPGPATLTPSAAGCTFKPGSLSFTLGLGPPPFPAGVAYFDARCASISGNIGVAGVRVNATSSAPALGSFHATSDAAGNYRIGTLFSQNTYTVTPVPTCGGFAPQSRSVSIPVGGAHVGGISFTPRQCVRGNVKVAGATITATAAGHETRTATSDANGDFTLARLDRNTAYTVKVTRTGGCPFTPASRAVTIGAADVPAVNFDTVCAQPNNPAFWTLGTSGLTTRAALLNRAAAQACRNGYYPQYFCQPALSSLQRKLAGTDEVVPQSHPSPDDGCSTPLEALPVVGIWAQGGAGVDNLWFRRSCHNHDQCYRHGFDPAWNNETWGANGTRNQCDTAWDQDNIRVCDSLGPQGGVCLALASVFIAAVRLGGQSSYHRDKNQSLTGTTLRCSPELSHVDTVGSLYHQVVHAVPVSPDTFCQALRLDFIFPVNTVVTTQYRAVKFSVPGGLPVVGTSANVYAICPYVGGRCNGDLVVDFTTPVNNLYVKDVLASTYTGQVGDIRVYRDGQILGQVSVYDGNLVSLSHLGRITRIVIHTAGDQSTQIDWIQFTRDPAGK